ncbi:ABC transporter permease [Vibrio sp. Of7-15]|uniref:ABC transporter permease n=1 Tax=Vibrio sp. Of7-15 TaxID=2724879 RepID=UPI001EF3CEEE|nr:FtsX-like permease family protein [Vibrio sp. Of7-15]MCG7495631.1 ABC transporter permease [Vibrio sp. Of7-15]
MRWIKFAWLNILRNRRRSLLTIMISAVATTALLSTAGFGLYTYQSLEEMSAREVGNITLSTPGYFEAEEDYPLELGMTDHESIQKQYLKDDDIRAVLPKVDFNGLISNGDKSSIFIGTGVDVKEFLIKGPILEIVEGQTLSGKPDPSEDPEIMLAEGLARNMKVGLGDIVTLLSTTVDGVLNAMDFEVKGIFRTGVPEMDKRLLYTTIDASQSLLDSDKVSSVSIFLYDHDLTLGKWKKVQSEQTELEVNPWWERAFYYEKVKNLYDNIFGMLGSVIAIMVFLAISNTMAITVVERTREIGTLAAMGSYRKEIVRNFTYEGMLMGLLGSLIGVVLTLGICIFTIVVEINMPPPPGSTMEYPVFVNFSPELATATVFALTFICTAAAWIIARKGAKKPIVEALSHV